MNFVVSVTVHLSAKNPASSLVVAMFFMLNALKGRLRTSTMDPELFLITWTVLIANNVFLLNSVHPLMQKSKNKRYLKRMLFQKLWKEQNLKIYINMNESTKKEIDFTINCKNLLWPNSLTTCASNASPLTSEEWKIVTRPTKITRISKKKN